jgi:hypothetical protein
MDDNVVCLKELIWNASLFDACYLMLRPLDELYVEKKFSPN